MYDPKCITNGMVSGVVAGIIFAFYLILGGEAETLGSLIGIPFKLGAMLVYFIASIIGGVIFALVLGSLIRSWSLAIFLGLVFGIALWILGPMTFLPSLNKGAPLLANWSKAGLEANSYSLIGHLLFGLVLGLSYCFLKKGKLHKLKKLEI